MLMPRMFGPEPRLHRRLDPPVGRRHKCASDVVHFLGAAIAHGHFQFALEDLEHTIDAGLTESTEPPQEYRRLWPRARCVPRSHFSRRSRPNRPRAALDPR